MKILLHIPWGIENDFVGGTERFVINLAKDLKKHGHEPFVVCSSLISHKKVEGVDVFGMIPKNYQEVVDKYGYANEFFFKNEIVGVKVSEESLIRFSNFVSEQIKDFEYDVCHLNGLFYSACLPDFIDKTKLIATMHESPEELDNYWGEGAFKLFARFAKKNNSFTGFGKLFTQSNYYAHLYSDELGVEVNKIALGVDLNYFPYRKVDKSKKNVPLILLPSRFEIKQKGHDIALKAFAVLNKAGINFQALFTGIDKEAYGGNLSDLDHELEKLNLSGKVEVRRFDDMNQAYFMADIVISPERFCSYGLSISESLALGKPTVLSPIPTYKEIAASCPYAFFVEKNEADYFVEKIKSIINKGFEVKEDEVIKFRTCNSFENCSLKYLNAYLELAKKNSL